MKRSCMWGASVLCLFLCLVGLLLFSFRSSQQTSLMTDKKALVATLQLTDLSLSSEARYTRHPSQADLFSAFQDSPGAFEHFPTGALILPELTGFDGRVYVLSADSTGE